MLPQLATAFVLMTQSNYPFESTSSYRSYIAQEVVQVDIRHERQKARIEARQKARQERQKQQELAAVSTPSAPSVSSLPAVTSNSSLPPLLALIRQNESGGNYSAINASGCGGYGCYGAYQLHGYYMDDWARRYGAAAYAGIPANQWPPYIQDKVALGLYYSTSPNGKFWCDWTSYC